MSHTVSTILKKLCCLVIPSSGGKHCKNAYPPTHCFYCKTCKWIQLMSSLAIICHTVGHFQGGNIWWMDYTCGATFHKEKIHEWLVLTPYEDVDERIFRRKLFVNWVQLQKSRKFSPSRITHHMVHTKRFTDRKICLYGKHQCC